MKRKSYTIQQSPDGITFVLIGKGESERSVYSDAYDLMVGAGSVMDLAGTRLKVPKFGTLRSDKANLNQDFFTIGNDMKDVLGEQLNFLEG